MDMSAMAGREARWTPEPPEALRSRLGDKAESERALRDFGTTRADLDVEFTGLGRPQLAVAVLRRCARMPDGAAVDEPWLWKLPIGERLHGLLAVVALTDARPFEVRLDCSCGEVLELDLVPGELLAFRRARSAAWPIRVAVGDGHSVQLRQPTGEDQLHWAALELDNANERAPTARMVIEHLVVGRDDGANLAEEWLPGLDRGLAEADPLVDFHVATRCPVCEVEVDVDVDVEELALARLEEAQRQFVRDVHRLAAVYHWSEEEIAALPPWRRARYLALVGEQRL